MTTGQHNFTLTIWMGNDAMQEGNDAMQEASDVATALRDVADKVEAHEATWGTIRDANGNTVGEWERS
jgi:hypothetical protein